MIRNGPLSQELAGLLAWIACIADARPTGDYVTCLEQAGFDVNHLEMHNNALSDMVRGIQSKLLGLELLVKLNKLTLPGIHIDQIRSMAAAAAKAVRENKLGYILLTGTKLEM